MLQSTGMGRWDRNGYRAWDGRMIHGFSNSAETATREKFYSGKAITIHKGVCIRDENIFGG